MIFRDFIIQASAEVIDIVNPLADKVALSEKILVDIRDRAAVQIDDRIPCIRPCEQRPVDNSRPYLHPRLQDGVTGFDLFRSWVKLSPVKHMGQCANQSACTLAW